MTYYVEQEEQVKDWVRSNCHGCKHGKGKHCYVLINVGFGHESEKRELKTAVARRYIRKLGYETCSMKNY